MKSLHILQWLYEMGADESIAHTPINRFTSPQNTIHAHPPMHTPISPVTRPVLGSNESIKLAEQVVQNITDLNSLCHALQSFTGCPLKNTAKHTLVYAGNPKPTLLCIGDTPTNTDEQHGRLLHGVTQKLLYRMGASIGITDTHIAYINRVFWYPPGGRTITQGEADTCMPFIKKIIEITQPKHILILGNDPAKSILQTQENMTKLNGKTTHIIINNVSYACTPTFGFKTIFSDFKRKRHVWHALKNIHIEDS